MYIGASTADTVKVPVSGTRPTAQNYRITIYRTGTGQNHRCFFSGFGSSPPLSPFSTSQCALTAVASPSLLSLSIALALTASSPPLPLTNPHFWLASMNAPRAAYSTSLDLLTADCCSLSFFVTSASEEVRYRLSRCALCRILSSAICFFHRFAY